MLTMKQSRSICLVITLIVLALGLSCSKGTDPPPPPPPVTGTVTDIDGNVYQTVKIGDQWWMAENLKVTHYRNGVVIPRVTNGTTWFVLTTGAYCEYNGDISNVSTYGRLYNWYAVDDDQSIAPEGWHVPTDEEWKQMEMSLGMSANQAGKTGLRGTNQGGKLKETGTTHWDNQNTDATNESGFSALPGGYRNFLGDFFNIGFDGIFWSATEANGNNTWNRAMSCAYSFVARTAYPKPSGMSVRCVKD